MGVKNETDQGLSSRPYRVSLIVSRALDLVPPASLGEPKAFVPTPAFPGLDPKADKILLRRSDGSDAARTPQAGMKLEMLTDQQREKADAKNVLDDKDRIAFLKTAVLVLTYPYVDMFNGMLPWGTANEGGIFRRRGEAVILRTDNYAFKDVRMAYDTRITYAFERSGLIKDLEKVSIYMGNNIDGPETSQYHTQVPMLSMTFVDKRMVSVAMRFDAQKPRVVRMLAGKSLLGDILKNEYGPKEHRGQRETSTILITLEPNPTVDLVRNGDPSYYGKDLKSRFTWEPRQKIFKNFGTNDGERDLSRRATLSQSDFLLLLRDVLSLVPVTEKGTFDHARQLVNVKVTPLVDLMKQVEKQNLASDEQLVSLFKLMEKDGKRMYREMGLEL